MERFSLSVLWLKIVSILFAIFGIIIALFNQTTIFQVAFNNQINPVFWTNPELTAETLFFQRWIYGLLGATCLMVGILIFFIVKNAFARKEKWAWNCLLVGLAAWFIIDTPISLYFQVYFNGKQVDLTAKEYAIMELMMKNQEKVFSKQNLYESVWSEQYAYDNDTINTHISNLRKKLDSNVIKTVWGTGYKLNTLENL